MATNDANSTDDFVLDLNFVIDAPRRDVFAAWTKTDQLRHWLAPREMTLLDVEFQPRSGGRWKARMRAAQGTEHSELGIVRECIAPTRLELTHAWLSERGKPGHETLISVDFTDEGTNTRLHFHQGIFETKQSRDRHGEGWLSAFGLLAELFGGTLSHITFGAPGVAGELLQATKPHVVLAKAQLGAAIDRGARRADKPTDSK